jgi:hypothetical protein
LSLFVQELFAAAVVGDLTYATQCGAICDRHANTYITRGFFAPISTPSSNLLVEAFRSARLEQ